jgi:PAS domain S-box-containing protein
MVANDSYTNGPESEKPDLFRQELEKKLRHSHQLLQYIIEHDFTAIAVLDTDLRYIYVSRNFLTDYNVTEKGILGKKHYEVFPDLPDAWKEVHQRALAGETLSSDEDHFPLSDGSTVWVRWVCKPWCGPDRSIEGIILYTEVITKKKEIEIQLRKAKEAAEESDRLKTAFLHNISHEVRTPLNSIVGFSELIAEPGQSIEKVKSYSKIISANSHKLIDIISDVIDISQIQSGRINVVLSKFEIVSVLNKVAGDFRELIQLSEISFLVHFNITKDKSVIVSDKRKIEKIVFHLLDNAVKFTKSGSIKIMSHIRDNHLYITVTDTGIGIDPDDQKKIFDPFWQLETSTNREFGGTGIGLTVVKAYANALGGSVSFTSVLNKGTTINVTVPVQTDAPKDHDVPEKKEAGQVSTILIAEDEFNNFRYLYEVLHSDKIKILHANNGSEAVDICRTSDTIDMILMDLKMPVMDGISAARQIRKIRPDVPIIAQTAYMPNEESNPVFDDLISKPIDRNELEQKVRRYIQ